jgi:hypothetical protein
VFRDRFEDVDVAADGRDREAAPIEQEPGHAGERTIRADQEYPSGAESLNHRPCLTLLPESQGKTVSAHSHRVPQANGRSITPLSARTCTRPQNLRPAASHPE